MSFQDFFDDVMDDNFTKIGLIILVLCFIITICIIIFGFAGLEKYENVVFIYTPPMDERRMADGWERQVVDNASTRSSAQNNITIKSSPKNNQDLSIVDQLREAADRIEKYEKKD